MSIYWYHEDQICCFLGRVCRGSVFYIGKKWSLGGAHRRLLEGAWAVISSDGLCFGDAG
jgi:hypothetical protein